MKPVRFLIMRGREELTSQVGVGLIGTLLGQTGLAARVDEVAVAHRPAPSIRHRDIVSTMTGLLALGKPDFAAVALFHSDPFFAYALGVRKLPSEATLRQRLDGLAGRIETIVREESAELVHRQAPVLTPCYQAPDARYGPWLALDVDVSAFDNSDTHKEGVSWTYREVDGYAPIFAYLGQEGYLLNCELRPGSQHSQQGAVAFLRQTLKLARRVTAAKLLVRMDAAHDAEENLRLLQTTSKVDYLIKRNLRRESVAHWLQAATELGERTVPREGKEVFIGETLVERGDQWERVVFEVVRRTITAAGQRLLLPEVEVQTWWTSLTAPPEVVIRLYREHSTCDQFHSELKSDLDLERLPSGKFATNHLLLVLAMLAYNLLRLCGQLSLVDARQQPPGTVPGPHKPVRRRRLRSVLQELMYVAARLVRHARRWALVFGRHNPWFGTWQRLYLRCSDA